MLNVKTIANLFAVALNEAVERITVSSLVQHSTPPFYCEELETFTGADGRKYVVEITVRPAED